MSSKALGKRRAVSPLAADARNPYESDQVNGIGSMDGTQDTADSSADELDLLAPSSSQARTPVKRTRTVEPFNDELGGSISRSARMRATSSLNGDGRDSEEESSDSSTGGKDRDAEEEGDHEAIATALHAFAQASGAQLSGSKFVTASTGEAYLKAMSKPAKTSNRKLSEQFEDRQSGEGGGGAFTQASYLAALESIGKGRKATKLEKRLQVLQDAYRGMYQQWDFELAEGFSLFFYGLGSKIRLLQEGFASTHLKRRCSNGGGDIVAVNGFMATLGVDDLLSGVERIVMSEGEAKEAGMGRSAAKLDERARTVVERLQGRKTPIYLLVHNIDGPGLRSFRAQATLSLLASQKPIRLIASFDHVKAPLLFPSTLATGRPTSTSIGYQILYHHVPTFRPYTVEALLSGTMSTLFSASLFLPDSALAGGALSGKLGAAATSEARARAAFFVLASLTQKAKDVFSLLAERQIASCPTSMNKKELQALFICQTGLPAPSCALPYPTVFSLARDRFLANNVNQFEALLREFRDHDVILSSSTRPEEADDEPLDPGQEPGAEEVGIRASEWIWIAIGRQELEDLLERLLSG